MSKTNKESEQQEEYSVEKVLQKRTRNGKVSKYRAKWEQTFWENLRKTE